VSSSFTRRTTVVRLRGAGEEGLGEDVTYDGEEQAAFQSAGTAPDLAGSFTLGSFAELVGSLDLFPGGEPRVPGWRRYRRWAFESAALDLALRQAGFSLAAALGRTPEPVRFVVSLRLDDPPDTARVRRLLELYPGTRLKLDPTRRWDGRLAAQLAALDCVETLDFKGAYPGLDLGQTTDLGLYRLLAETFPAAWLEDPHLADPAIERALAPHRDRVTWDAPVHAVSDIEALPFPPRMLNFKPSRFGSLRDLLDAYDHCAERGIGIYGGGQFELGPGRGQIQYLASLFHADAPNDVAPAGYNERALRAGLPASPLAPAPAPAGFRWGPE
jgi:L-alanine-DL-glutamate epimerase-like enolase superfamily enzyme